MTRAWPENFNFDKAAFRFILLALRRAIWNIGAIRILFGLLVRIVLDQARGSYLFDTDELGLEHLGLQIAHLHGQARGDIAVCFYEQEVLNRVE